jgi:S1-C subfamily serine protease
VWGNPPNGRPYIGVRGEVDGKEARVVELVSGQAGEKSGLEVGDIILSFDRQAVSSFAVLQELVSQTAPGETIRLRIRRGERELVLGIQIGRRP